VISQISISAVCWFAKHGDRARRDIEAAANPNATKHGPFGFHRSAIKKNDEVAGALSVFILQ
jgi:hypothetical protein